MHYSHKDVPQGRMKQLDQLRNELQNFLETNELNHDVRFYTKAEWRRRGEQIGNMAEMSMTFEGPLYRLLNYMDFPGADLLFKQFDSIIARHKLHWEFGFGWSMHFY